MIGFPLLSLSLSPTLAIIVASKEANLDKASRVPTWWMCSISISIIIIIIISLSLHLLKAHSSVEVVFLILPPFPLITFSASSSSTSSSLLYLSSSLVSSVIEINFAHNNSRRISQFDDYISLPRHQSRSCESCPQPQ